MIPPTLPFGPLLLLIVPRDDLMFRTFLKGHQGSTLLCHSWPCVCLGRHFPSVPGSLCSFPKIFALTSFLSVCLLQCLKPKELRYHPSVIKTHRDPRGKAVLSKAEPPLKGDFQMLLSRHLGQPSVPDSHSGLLPSARLHCGGCVGGNLKTSTGKALRGHRRTIS